MTREEFYKLSPDDRLKATEALVEANDNERQYLWCEYSREAAEMGKPVYQAFDWQAVGEGSHRTVGVLNINGTDWPVAFNIFWGIIAGHVVGFYYDTSVIVDHRQIRSFIDQHCPNSKVRTDAQNFHLVVDALGLDR